MKTANKETGIKVLEKKGNKVTLLCPGSGMMGCDVVKEVVTQGYFDSAEGMLLAYAEPRGKKKFRFDRILAAGIIVLHGHVKDQRKLFESQTNSFIMDGVGGRFLDTGDGGQGVIDFIKEHLAFHTLKPGRKLFLVRKCGSGMIDREVVEPDFAARLMEALGAPEGVAPVEPPPPTRVELLTLAMKLKLKEANGKAAVHPLFKIFNPEGSQTWLLFSMEDDGDTLWCVADIGMGCVEYGTVSLTELETTKGARFKMPFERDLHFDGSRYTLSELLEKTSLSC